MAGAGGGGQTTVMRFRDGILNLVAERGLKAGEKIPTEAELKAHLGGSRPTIREALKLLEQAGILSVEHGRGRFLTAAGTLHVARSITQFESITEMAGHFGYSYENRVLGFSEETPDKAVRAALKLAPGETIIRLERLRLHERKPLIYCLAMIRRSLISDPIYEVDWSGSLNAVLGRYGYPPRMSTAEARAEMLPESAVSRHGLSDFGPAFLIDETVFTRSGEPIMFASDWYKGSHFAFNFARK